MPNETVRRRGQGRLVEVVVPRHAERRARDVPAGRGAVAGRAACPLRLQTSLILGRAGRGPPLGPRLEVEGRAARGTRARVRRVPVEVVARAAVRVRSRGTVARPRADDELVELGRVEALHLHLMDARPGRSADLRPLGRSPLAEEDHRVGRDVVGPPGDRHRTGGEALLDPDVVDHRGRGVRVAALAGRIARAREQQEPRPIGRPARAAVEAVVHRQERSRFGLGRLVAEGGLSLTAVDRREARLQSREVRAVEREGVLLSAAPLVARLGEDASRVRCATNRVVVLRAPRSARPTR